MLLEGVLFVIIIGGSHKARIRLAPFRAARFRALFTTIISVRGVVELCVIKTFLRIFFHHHQQLQRQESAIRDPSSGTEVSAKSVCLWR